MQIADDIYVDIRIPAKSKSVLLKPKDLLGLYIRESAGVSLPFIICKIRVDDNEMASYFKQNNEVLVTLGTTASDSRTFPVLLENPDVSSDGANAGRIIEFSGFLYSKEYMVNQSNEPYEGTSLEVVKKVYTTIVKKPVKTDIIDVKEPRSIWRRPNTSACAFLANVLAHMRLTPSFPLYAIDKFGTLIIKDFYEMCKKGPQYALSTNPSTPNSYVFYNNFNIENDRDMYNLFSGYNRRIEVLNSTKGEQATILSINAPVLASTKVSEAKDAGSSVTVNVVQSDNVHPYYKETFYHNMNNIVALSSIHGKVTLTGKYYPEIAPLDLVTLVTGKGDKDVNDGLYIVETVETSVVTGTDVINTILTLTRDNVNYIENYVKKDKKINIRPEWLQDLCAGAAALRRAYAVGKRFFDGVYMSYWLNYALETKRNLLRMFSVAGVAIDFNSNAKLIQSFLNIGNSLMNSLTSMIFPETVAITLRDYLLKKPTLINLIYDYIGQFVPYELRDIVIAMVESLDKTTKTLNSIARDNGITADKIQETGEKDLTEKETSTPQRVTEILDSFQENTSGVDLPLPIINLNESQALLPEKELRDFLVSETILNLTNLGYLKDIDTDEFKDILEGKEEINFDVINKINKNIGTKYNYKFWGTFASGSEPLYAWRYNNEVVFTKTPTVGINTRLYNNDASPYSGIFFKVAQDESRYIVKYFKTPLESYEAERDQDEDIYSDALVQLTGFYIRKQYKDKYRTIPCTKLVSALKGARLFFACPKAEKDLKFYVNSKRIELPSFDLSLGYTDSNGNDILYTVYYTKDGYNSNSVLLEVKQGGMV